ncbi:MAG: hypothetical protein A3I05_04490 [Deltaproteobacteria bacterium RIFCSPLOWO2_02_FULL_44_10]|nr:MAG: hypothetical protein A3C46_07295 [Deltaproteobacteria bacterium RIFCSPHIGHO2_02_FULL_44_16]OGQ46616.1 MAG: hypothetical protein A3I05_04490 [Deltaproteobacteria bacterium RIFCSPLOWO2_02_FULL_44_10]
MFASGDTTVGSIDTLIMNEDLQGLTSGVAAAGQIVSAIGSMIATGHQLQMQFDNIDYQIKTAEEDKNLKFADMDSQVKLAKDIAAIQKSSHPEIEKLQKIKGDYEAEKASSKTLDAIETTSTLDVGKLKRYYAGLLREHYNYGRPR